MALLVKCIKHSSNIKKKKTKHYYTRALWKEEKIFPYSFYKASMTLMPKSEKDITKKES